MAKQTADRLYDRLPAIYRERDTELDKPLKALLKIIQGQADLVESDIWQLWDNFFIETCEPWVIPYIGDLVGTLPLFDASRIKQPDTARRLFPDLVGPRLIPEVGLRGRADVAKTIYFRRRKGTLPMLEELARDVTGWAAHAVEFFELIGWAQCVHNHLRMGCLRTPDIRQIEPMDRLDGPFDEISHTVDVRPISQLTGWYHIKNIGFFLWRLRSYEAENVKARPVGGKGDYRYHFSPLGNSAPLFTRWRREGDEAGLATELHVPGPIRPARFYEDLKGYQERLPEERPGYTEFYGLFDELSDPQKNPQDLPQAPASSMMTLRDGVAVPPENVRCMDLSVWRQPKGQVVGVDVRQGRLAFGDAWIPTKGVDVFYHYGFSADMGGGPYARRAWQVNRSLADLVIQVDQSGVTPGSFTSLVSALDKWNQEGKPKTIITVLDSRTYEETVILEPADDRWLVIEAADGERPHLLLNGPLEITGSHPDSSVTLSGLLIEGWVHMTGSLGRLRLLHSTLVPGHRLTQDGLPATTEPSLIVEPGPADEPLNTQLRVEMGFSITGPLRIPDHGSGLWVLDSVLDGLGTSALCSPDAINKPGPVAWLERVTVFGPSRVRELPMASETIFTNAIQVDRQQAGCVRFSFVPEESKTPKRYRCQPDQEINSRIEEAKKEAEARMGVVPQAQQDAIRRDILDWLVPTFTSSRYGQPEYAQLHLACARQIQTGAEDGSEMGAFCHLKQPQREANLRLRLEEYLPFGLENGMIDVT